MTKKDYVAIAKVILFTAAWYPSDKLLLVAQNMSDTLQQDNPRFDRERFLKACGVQS